jgi:hypothetical protein
MTDDKKDKSVFDILNGIDVNSMKERKGNFDYLSWVDAVAVLLKHFPDATWEVHEYNGSPFLATECGYFTKVSVTINNITRTQVHPVLDYRNKSIAKPSSFEINTSIQRALAKAIALHGLGLYIFRGEDLPSNELSIAPKVYAASAPKATAGNTLKKDIQVLRTINNLPELKKVFTVLYTAAEKAKDQEALDALLVAKDKRKEELLILETVGG